MIWVSLLLRHKKSKANSAKWTKCLHPKKNWSLIQLQLIEDLPLVTRIPRDSKMYKILRDPLPHKIKDQHRLEQVLTKDLRVIPLFPL